MNLEIFKRPIRAVVLASRKRLHKLRIPIRIHGVWVLSYELRSEVILAKIFNRVYEIDEVREILPKLKEDDTVLELGAAIGVVTCAMAKKVKKGKILAFEPNPVIADLCERHLHLNSISNVNLRRSVAGLSEGVTKFYVASDYWSSSLENIPGSTEIGCKVEKLESILSHFMPSVVVMDIEGGEYELLGSGFFTKNTSVRLIVVEFHPVRDLFIRFRQLESALEGFVSAMPLPELLQMLQQGHQPTVTFTRL